MNVMTKFSIVSRQAKARVAPASRPSALLRNPTGIVFVFLAWLCVVPTSAGAQTHYTNNFDKAEVGTVPGDLMVLDGLFTVREEGGNKFLELPGAPTDTYTVMFGPVTNVNVAVSARIHSTNKGRRMPAFGVSLCGIGGYKLQVAAAKRAVELFKGEALMKTAEYKWR